MYQLPRIVLVCCLLLFTAGQALAELNVTFINRTDFEIQGIAIKGDGGGMSSTIRVVPGNSCVFTDGNSEELHEVNIDAGLMLFTFTNMQDLAGNARPTLELSFDANDRPHLTLVDKGAYEAGADGGDGGNGESGSISLDLPAGPIWNNDHAQERCPEVLEEWQAANPDKQAEWTGNWLTVKQGEMSVCGIRYSTGQTQAPAEAALPSLINFVGSVTVFADPASPAETEFPAIIQAGSMGDLKAMGARTAQMWDSQVYLPAAFLDKVWAVFVEPEDAFSKDNAAKPGTCMLRTYSGGPKGVAPLMESMAALGYRPWYAQMLSGRNMDLADAIKFHASESDAEENWQRMSNLGSDINSTNIPAALELIILSGEDYARAASGESPAVPGFRLRISNAAVFTLQYLRDISPFIDMTR